MKKIFKRLLPPSIVVMVIILIWQLLSINNIFPSYMLPSPYKVITAFIDEFDVLCYHGIITVWEAILGIIIGIIISLVMAILMDMCAPIRHGLYPLLVTSQTIPAIAIAPLLLLWFGYGILPKIILIVITTFFPITVSLLEGFSSADKDSLKLIRLMGGNRFTEYIHIKFPEALGHFFSGLKISVTYSIIGAVISEWLGGTRGLGVYMTRVRKSFDYDKMFAVIFYVILISLLLLLIVSVIKWLAMPWERKKNNYAKN